jgi:prepilin-type processing-associated H-X9-DG protein
MVVVKKGTIAAFSRTDLIVVVLVIIMAGFLAILGSRHFTHGSPRIKVVASVENPALRETVCMENLQELGLAMNMYAQDNNDKLPFAFITYHGSISWDSLISPYVPQDHEANGSQSMITSSTFEKNDANDDGKIFLCSADTIPASNKKALRRTYSMPAHDMTIKDWPPGPQNSSGVGLWWSDRGKGLASTTNLFGEPVKRTATATPAPAAGLETIAGLKPPPAGQAGSNVKLSDLLYTNQIPAITLGMVPAPGRTLLLTEQARSNNLLWGYSCAVIHNAHEHLDETAIPTEKYHGGKFNYLMVDGHVEMLFAAQSEGKEEVAGLKNVKHTGDDWTIRPDD